MHYILFTTGVYRKEIVEKSTNKWIMAALKVHQKHFLSNLKQILTQYDIAQKVQKYLVKTASRLSKYDFLGLHFLAKLCQDYCSTKL